MPEFDENTNFQLPGLGSAEKDTPGSFRAGTPLYKVNGDPETEVSQELTDIKEAQKEVKKSNVVASMAQALANKDKADLNKRLENADAPVQDSVGLPHQDRNLALTGSEFIMEGGMGAAGGIPGALRALKNKQR